MAKFGMEFDLCEQQRADMLCLLSTKICQNLLSIFVKIIKYHIVCNFSSYFTQKINCLR